MVEEDVRERLAKAYVPLRRFAAVVGSLDVDPDDLVQEAFARVLRRGIDEVDDLDRYLRRTVMNLAANENRRLGRLRRLLPLLARPEVEGTSYFSDVAELLRLPPPVRAVLWLAEIEGWTYSEIADVVGCSEQAARARASRGRQSLRAALEGEHG